MSLDLGRPRRLYFVGLGGMGMSALARYLLAQGHVIAGSDQADSPLLADLRAEGIAAHAGHSAEHLAASGGETVVVSAAIPPDNPEVRAARTAGLPVLTLAEAVGVVAADRRVLAIAGTHGKTTTTSMIAYVLDRAGLAPSFLLGGLVPDLGGNARFGAGELLAIEADEYAGRFLTLRPTVAVVTNLEHDHPDVYPDWASLEAIFRRWLAQVRPGGLALLRADDAGSARLVADLRLAEGVRRESFAFHPTPADWTAEPLPPDPSRAALPTRARLRRDGEAVGELALRSPAALRPRQRAGRPRRLRRNRARPGRRRRDPGRLRRRRPALRAARRGRRRRRDRRLRPPPDRAAAGAGRRARAVSRRAPLVPLPAAHLLAHPRALRRLRRRVARRRRASGAAGLRRPRAGRPDAHRRPPGRRRRPAGPAGRTRSPPPSPSSPPRPGPAMSS